LGSLVLNNAISQFVEESRHDAHLALRHVVGPRFMKTYANPIANVNAAMNYQVVAYEENMSDVYASVDLLIGRGGAGTIADIAATGVPAILIPWKDASDDHQTSNVKYLSESGAAVLIAEDQVAEKLIDTVTQLRANPALLHEISIRAFEMGVMNRQGRIAEVIQDVALGRQR
jgi:UDP-N-acetylglucosamine--N-acetylmuramyl-(pentapeptide) pyrophosphoryl-undecaprenol N-acetylglucosamine transferase